MKKKIGMLMVLLALGLFASPAEASHEGYDDYFQSHTPKKTKTEFTEEDEKRISELKTTLNKAINKYNDAVVKKANKLREEHGFTYQWNAINAVPKARHLVYQEGKIFGKPGTYFEGGEVESTVRELWESYGIKFHLPIKNLPALSNGCILEKCSAAPNTIVWPDDITVKDEKIVDWLVNYGVNWIEDETVYKTAPNEAVVASDGLFTNSDIKQYGGCNIEAAKKELVDDMKTPKINAKPEESVEDPPAFKEYINGDKIGQGLRTMFQNMLTEMNGSLYGTDCNGDSLSAVSQFTNISRPLNLTDNPYIMKLVHITQQIAFTLAIVFIAFYALMYTSGFENMDPVKFSIRLFLSLLAISYLPWLMQDMLNLNNMLVYNISTLEFDFAGLKDANSTDILMGALTALLHSILSADNIKENLLILLFAIVMAFVALVPLFKVIVWWYTRLLTIFLGAIVGPILVAMAALPQTEDKTKTWVTQFIGTVFTQVFMAFGLLMVAIILSNLGPFGEILGVGWFGRAVLVIAAIFFLAEVPEFAKSFLKTFGGASDKVSGVMKKVPKGIKTAKKGAQTAGKVAGATASGVAGAAVATAKVGGMGLKAAAKTGTFGAKATLGTIGALSGAKAAAKGGHASSGIIGGLVRKTKSGQTGYQRGKSVVTGAKAGYKGTSLPKSMGSSRSLKAGTKFGKAVATSQQKLGNAKRTAGAAVGQSWNNAKHMTQYAKHTAQQTKENLKRKMSSAFNSNGSSNRGNSQPTNNNGNGNNGNSRRKYKRKKK